MSARRVSRRMFLGGSVVLAGALTGATEPGSASASTGSGGALSRASRVFLERGLFIGAWVSTPATGRPTPSATEWRTSNFSTATFYEAPYFNPGPGAGTWAMAVYPDGGVGGKLDRGPKPGERLLSTVEQRSHAAGLFTVCFGDEELYDPAVVDRLTAWFALARSQHPDVLVHNNQFATEWSQDELRSYVRKAKPDLLTFDSYYFSAPDPYPGGGRADVYDALNNYRVIALAGHDGTGQSPIVFGHYTEGFKGGSDYSYVPSESELNLDYYAAWTMGARWTNLFRWEHDSAVFLLYRKDGTHTPQFHQLARIAHAGGRLSPFLVRLSSTAVRIIPGRHRDASGALIDNSVPATVPVWDSFASPYISAIEGDRDADILVGYFRQLPGLSAAAAVHGLPAAAARLFTTKYVKPFMLLNGGIAPNSAGTTDSTDGSGRQTRQRISVTLQRLGNTLVRVDRVTGLVAPVPLRAGPGGTDRFAVDLDGGVAELFLLTTWQTYDQPPYFAVTTAIDAMAPNQSFTLRGTAANDTVDQPIPDVQARVIAPAGWSLQPDGSTLLGDLRPGQSADTSWEITIPADATPGAYQLTGETTYQYGPHSSVRGGARATATVHIPFGTLADGFDNAGITDDSAPGAGDIDGDGDSYSAQALSALGITPGAAVPIAGFTFHWPAVAPGKPDNVACAGQAFSVGESGARLGFLGSCTYGSGGGTGTVIYTDGSSQPFELTFPDWYGDPPADARVVAKLPYRNSPNGRDSSTVSLYVASIDLSPTKTVATLLLPPTSDAASDGAHSGIVAMHIFAIAVA